MVAVTTEEGGSTQADPVVGPQHWIAPWCKEDDIPPKRVKDVRDVDLARAIAGATNLLYVLSGRQYRTGRSVVRPSTLQSGFANQSYLYPYSSMSGYGSAWGFAGGWAWAAIGMGWWQNGQDLSELLLQGPVRRINNVLLNGQSLGGWPPPNPNYTLYDKRRLILTVGSPDGTTNAWPWEQQLGLPLSLPGTFAVDYEWGREPPPAGVIAAIELSIAVANALSGDTNTALPARVLSVVTQGVSVAVGDPLTYIREDLTGLPLVDMFLNAVNPAKLRRRSVFMGPNTVIGREQPGGPSIAG